MNYQKGFLRLWLIISLVWSGSISLLEFPTEDFITISNFVEPKNQEQGDAFDDAIAELDYAHSKSSLINFFLLLFGPPIGLFTSGLAVRYIDGGFREK